MGAPRDLVDAAQVRYKLSRWHFGVHVKVVRVRLSANVSDGKHDSYNITQVSTGIGAAPGCRTGNREKLSSTQEEPVQAIKSGFAYFPSISCTTSWYKNPWEIWIEFQ